MISDSLRKLTPGEAQERLFALRDEKYKAFHCGLMPTVDPDAVIGVRVPALRKLAKELWKECDVRPFWEDLPHRYYEENNLHGFLIEQVRDYDCCMELLQTFLPRIDNWATCDMVAPKVLGQRKEALFEQIGKWMESKETYTVRYAMGMLMRHFLEEDFRPEYLRMVAEYSTEEYYIRMMQAWFFATALAKQYEAALPYIENGVLEPWTHNKAIQKAVESYRITPQQKAYLKQFRRVS